MRACIVSVMAACLAGCIPVYQDIDHRVCSRALVPVDPLPPAISSSEARSTPAAPRFRAAEVADGKAQADVVVAAHAQATQDLPSPRTLNERLRLHVDLPGVRQEDVKLPPPTASRVEFNAAIDKYFPPLPDLPSLPAVAPGKLDLSELQKIALTNSPLIRQAILDVESARGKALQAGLAPNTVFGYEGDTIGQARSPGLQGGYISQTVKTAGKLKLARSAAMVEVQIAEAKWRGVEADVRAQVRSGYFATLAARRSLEVSRSLAQLTGEIYQVLLLQLRAGEVAAYEPMQLRVAALQSRGLVLQCHNRYISAWKQLAATLGVPALPLTELAGQVDMPIPRLQYDRVLAQVLSQNTEVAAAELSVDRNRILLQLARVQPIPDVDLRVMLQHDNTTPPFQTVTSVVVQAPLPTFDRNQGNIQAAHAAMQSAIEDNHRVRNELTRKVAAAFERYENNRQLLILYRDEMLPNQVQAFRAAVARHAAVGEKGISYYDVVNSQQSLSALLANYLSTLRDQWEAVSELSNLTQTADLFQTHEVDAVSPVPDLQSLAPVGSTAPCNPLPDPQLRTGNGDWPSTLPHSK